MRKFIQICKKNQEELKDFLEKKLRKKYQSFRRDEPAGNKSLLILR